MKKILLLLLCGMLGAAPVRMLAQTQKSGSVVTIGGESYYVHTVKPGDTFYSLGKAYDTDEETIRRNNPHVADGLKTDQVLKIPVARATEKPLSDRKKKRLFEVHTVNQGETAYSISKRYGVGLDVLMEDNEGFDPTRLSIGQQINIRKSSVGTSDNTEIKGQIESYKEALNSVSDRFTHHVVAKGETLYSLGRQYGLPVDSITRYNDAVLRDGLKVGAILRLPAPSEGTPDGTMPSGGTVPDVPVTETPAESGMPSVSIVPGDNLPVKRIDANAPIRVAMLLPLRVESTPNRQFLEFYQGALLALDDLKRAGVSARLDLFNTGKSVAETEAVLQNPELRQADLIIGPVYDETFTPAAEFAARYGIPIVSPLGTVESADNSLVFQAAPGPSTKNDKLKADLSPDHNVIVVSAAQNDAEFQQEIRPLLPQSARRLDYAKGMAGSVLENLLSGDRDNVIVVLSSDETTTDAILAYISSIQNSLVSRSIRNPVIRVVGSSRWARFRNIEKNLFFKLNLRYVTSYHADRGNERVANFDRRYIADFGSLPSLYSYRGYDVTKLFVGAIKLHGAGFARVLDDKELPLLETPYRFVQKGSGHRYENDEWALVCYNSNYTIEVK